MQSLIREIVTGAYNIRHIAPPSEFPLRDPFGPPPTDDEAECQRRAGNEKGTFPLHLVLPVKPRCHR